MFLRRHDHALYIDLSDGLREPGDWNVGSLRSFEYPLNITTFAIEPITRLLAIGTGDGVIHIHGGYGVETRLCLPEQVAVKFLQFATSSSRIVCLDDNNQLHLWDLSSYGRPQYMVTARFDSTNCLTLSPSHSHAFLALSSGEVRTYDLLCLRKSIYTMPNMWKLYEEKMAATRISEGSTPTSRISVDIVIHPRDLNLVFVAYEGGVILSDLTQRSTLRAYELVVPPGAPGGAGYGSADILTIRRPAVTAIAVHPAGHFFVVGYADGSLAFWAIEDEDRPLLVRTLDTMDVITVDGDKLDASLSDSRRNSRGSTPTPSREPIFKLSWSGFPNSSDPRGGETALTILGGLENSSEAIGLSVDWLPAFNPVEPPTPNPNAANSLNPFIRTAMRNSVIPSKTYFYYTSGIIQDFLLAPRNNPHFSGSYDPDSILMLTESAGNTRIIEAYQFPPSSFVIDDETGNDSPSEDLASTLRSLTVCDDPQTLRTPSMLWNASTGLLNGQLLKLERDSYATLIDGDVVGSPNLALTGGLAWADETKSNELKLSKYQPHRILITHHRNLTVQFHDISAQLLISVRPTPIEHHFPSPLSDLTIDLNAVFIDPDVSRRLSPSFFDQATINSVDVASDSLECVVTLKTGEAVVFRLPSGPRREIARTQDKELSDHELIMLEHVLIGKTRFSPHFMLAPGSGPTTACALSNIGFLATAYSDGSLCIVDMRGPNILLRHSPDKRAKNKHPVLHIGRSDHVDPIMSLTWTICSIEKDSRCRIRLIAIHLSGAGNIFTLELSAGSASPYTIGDPVVFDAVTNPFPHGTFIVDSKRSVQWKADKARLANSFHTSTVDDSRPILVAAGAKGVRCILDINGERIARIEWGSKVGSVQSVQIVEKMGFFVLVAITDRHEALVYSVPDLELMHTLQLPNLLSSLPLSMDETGDFIAWSPHSTSGTINQATYGTLFDIRRAYTLPDIELFSTKPVVPAQPQPVPVGPTSLLGSWFRFGQSMSGDQLDILLGGPDRPIPERRQERIQTASEGPSAGAKLMTTATGVHNDLYGRLSSALNERGQLLGDLEERFNSLEEGSKSMVAQAKRLAAQQTTKSWLGL